MRTNFSFLGLRTGLICAGTALFLPSLYAAGADASSDADAFPNFESYIKITGQDPWISGDSAAFAARNGTPSTGAAGIEDLYYTKDISDDTTYIINGRYLEGSDDYLGSFNLAKDGLGSLDIGYKRFRTFYDGVGGFFPLADQFQAMSPEDLHVDRSAFWFEAKLAKPDRPAVTISYHNEIRTGQKDSSEWAPIINPNAVIVKGALVGNAVPANTPEINPNVLTLDEHHNLLDVTVTDTVGKTTETLKATLDWVNNDDVRSYIKYPNSTVIADPTVDVALDDQEAVKTNSFRILSQTETKLSNIVSLDVGLTYLHLTGDDGGEWITPTYSSTANAVYSAITAGNITADPKEDDYVGNIMLKITPNKDWLAEAGFRQEYNVISDGGSFITTTLATGATTTASTNITTSQDDTYSHTDGHVASPEVEIQYLGIRNLCIYSSFDDRIDRDNQHWVNPYAAVTTTGSGVVTVAPPPISSVFFQDADQDNRDAKLGANWNPTTQLTLRAEVYRKDHQNRFIGSDDYVGTASYGALYATGYTYTGVNLTAKFRASAELSFTTRYQQQDGRMSVLSNAITGGLGTESPSGKTSGQTISETIDWSPYRQLYFQVNGNLVYNYIQTAFPAVVVTTASPAIPSPIENANNNYYTSSALCGFVLDKKTDVQIRGALQRADNYNPEIAAGGEPYGASYEMESVSLGLKHKFSERVLGDAKVGYLKMTDPTTGGFTNYKGPLAYAALTVAL